MAPAPRQSGARPGRGRISKTGNTRLRRIAHLSALGASKSRSRLRTYSPGLQEKGKPPQVALIALDANCCVLARQLYGPANRTRTAFFPRMAELARRQAELDVPPTKPI